VLTGRAKSLLLPFARRPAVSVVVIVPRRPKQWIDVFWRSTPAPIKFVANQTDRFNCNTDRARRVCVRRRPECHGARHRTKSGTQYCHSLSSSISPSFTVLVQGAQSEVASVPADQRRDVLAHGRRCNAARIAPRAGGTIYKRIAMHQSRRTCHETYTASCGTT
jgi:hypothetical protein